MKGFFLAALALPLMLTPAVSDDGQVTNSAPMNDAARQTPAEQLKLSQKEVSDAHDAWQDASRACQDLLKKLAHAEATNTREKYWRTQAFNAATILGPPSIMLATRHSGHVGYSIANLRRRSLPDGWRHSSTATFSRSSRPR